MRQWFRVAIDSDVSVTSEDLLQSLAPFGRVHVKEQSTPPQNKAQALTKERLLRRRHIDVTTGCWLWSGAKHRYGYGKIGSHYKVHGVPRVAAMLWLGLPDNSPLRVLHLCDNPRCFNPEHLRLGTQKENIQDMIAKGRRGKCGTKLTSAAADSIRLRYGQGRESQQQIADDLGISQTLVSYVVRNQAWSTSNAL